jgi:hypothetical protein
MAPFSAIRVCGLGGSFGLQAPYKAVNNSLSQTQKHPKFFASKTARLSNMEFRNSRRPKGIFPNIYH